jgi:hypothetical protein
MKGHIFHFRGLSSAFVCQRLLRVPSRLLASTSRHSRTCKGLQVAILSNKVLVLIDMRWCLVLSRSTQNFGLIIIIGSTVPLPGLRIIY